MLIDIKSAPGGRLMRAFADMGRNAVHWACTHDRTTIPDDVEAFRNVSFLSDNCTPACPEVMDAISEANVGNEPSYGGDTITSQASSAFQQLFNSDCAVFFVASGVAANALSLAAVCPPFRSIVCHEHAHVNKDECGAIPFFTGGSGLLPIEGKDLKLTPERIRSVVTSRQDIHFQRPIAVTITQATEVGTVYSPDELSHLSQVAKELGLFVHIDGARLANAVAHLNVPISSITSEIGIDLLSFGGSKNGLHFGEAIIIFNRTLVDGFRARIKQTGHLLSKARFLSAGWLALLDNDLWLTNAQKANRAAQYLSKQLLEIEGIEITYPCQANCVLIHSVPEVISAIASRLHWSTYRFIMDGTLRFACSWCTSPQEIDLLVEDLKAIVVQITRT